MSAKPPDLVVFHKRSGEEVLDGVEVDDAIADGHPDPPPTLFPHAEDAVGQVGVGEVAPIWHRDPRHLVMESAGEKVGIGQDEGSLVGRI